MIDVPELDIYLKTFHYALNFGSVIYDKAIFSKNTAKWVTFIKNNQGMLQRFKEILEKPEFGFQFEVGLVNSMYGLKEVKGLRDPNLMLPAPFLKIYPRLLYQYEFLPKPKDFESHTYHFRYYPKMIVNSYTQRPDDGKMELYPTEYWILGTHTNVKGENRITYNVAVEVNLRTVIEEELHAEIPELHGTTTVKDVEEKIDKENPKLKSEIEMNLNRILSTEEKKFKDVGVILRLENSNELRILEKFVDIFESDVINNTSTDFYDLALTKQKAQAVRK